MEQLPSPNRGSGLYEENFYSNSLGGWSDASLRGSVTFSNSDWICTHFRLPTGHAASFAGGGTGTASGQPESDPFADPFARTIPAGILISVLTNPEVPEQDRQPADADEQPPYVDEATPPAASHKLPLYKRRWFMITSIIGTCVGIALLFIILYPVLRAVVQDVINKSSLNIQQAGISSPSNTS